MTDPAKLREAVDNQRKDLMLAIVAPSAATEEAEERVRVLFAAGKYLALLESSDVILIRRDAEGNWPRKARQKVSFALSEAAGLERRNALTASAFLTIQYELLNALAGAGIDD